MAGRSNLGPPINVPDSKQEQAEDIKLLKLQAIKNRIEEQYPDFKNKFAEILAHARAKHGQDRNVSIKNTLIGALDVIYENFDNLVKREKYIAAFDEFLKVLSKHDARDGYGESLRDGLNGYTKSARHAFIYFFHKLLRKRDTLPTDFLTWFQGYIKEWQNKNLFGVGFDFERWKITKATDLLKTNRNLDVYPKKNWHYEEALLNFHSRQSSEEDLAPRTDEPDKTRPEFAIADIYNNPALLLYFLVEYNILHLTERQYQQVLNVIKQGEEQVGLLEDLLEDIPVFSKPIVRIMHNRNDVHPTMNVLTLAILKKLQLERVPICVLASDQAASLKQNEIKQEKFSRTNLVDPDGRSHIIVYTNKGPQTEKVPEEIVDEKGIKHRMSYIYASSSHPVSDKHEEYVTNMFATDQNKKVDGLTPYVVHRVVQLDAHHFELLKITSIRLLEEYLTKANVAVDRLKNAMCLLKNIQELTMATDALVKLDALLLKAKDRAQEKDRKVNASRFQLFHRNRSGSRYITLLDDLRERINHCQPQEQKNHSGW